MAKDMFVLFSKAINVNIDLYLVEKDGKVRVLNVTPNKGTDTASLLAVDGKIFYLLNTTLYDDDGSLQKGIPQYQVPNY